MSEASCVARLTPRSTTPGRPSRGRISIVENYPNLKSDANFQRLMDELSGTENRIATERMRYNERVQEYNTSRRQFPGVLTAKLFTFKDYPLFEAPPEARQVPKVTF